MNQRDLQALQMPFGPIGTAALAGIAMSFSPLVRQAAAVAQEEQELLAMGIVKTPDAMRLYCQSHGYPYAAVLHATRRGWNVPTTPDEEAKDKQLAHMHWLNCRIRLPYRVLLPPHPAEEYDMGLR